MRIIPAMDIINGECVRLAQGDYARKKKYSTSPIDTALAFEKAGLDCLHLVDLDGAREGRVINWPVIEMLSKETTLQIDFGGGIKKAEDIDKLLEIGIKQVNLGSIAAKEPGLVSAWIHEYGRERILLSADVKNGVVAVAGWREETLLPLEKFIEDYIARGILHVVCTDISADGMLAGPNFTLYQNLTERFPETGFIASGGIRSISDVQALEISGVEGAIIGKAIYEGHITLQQLGELNKNSNESPPSC